MIKDSSDIYIYKMHIHTYIYDLYMYLVITQFDVR